MREKENVAPFQTLCDSSVGHQFLICESFVRICFLLLSVNLRRNKQWRAANDLRYNTLKVFDRVFKIKDSCLRTDYQISKCISESWQNLELKFCCCFICLLLINDLSLLRPPFFISFILVLIIAHTFRIISNLDFFILLICLLHHILILFSIAFSLRRCYWFTSCHKNRPERVKFQQTLINQLTFPLIHSCLKINLYDNTVNTRRVLLDVLFSYHRSFGFLVVICGLLFCLRNLLLQVNLLDQGIRLLIVRF